jgi:hypothetical protein
MTRKNALATLGVILAASVAACSYIVDADRSKVSNTDTLYQPTPMEGGASDGQAMGDASGDGAGGDATMPDGSTEAATPDAAGNDAADAATTDGAPSDAEAGPTDAAGG